jgi:hypothetical protein
MAESLTLAMLDKAIEAIREFSFSPMLSLEIGHDNDCCVSASCFGKHCAERLTFISCVYQKLQEPRLLAQRDSDIVDALRWATSTSWRSEYLIAEQP